MMLRRFSPLVLALQFLVDLVLTLLAVKIAEQARLHISTGFELREQFVSVKPGWYVLVLVVWALFFLLFGALDSARKTSVLRDLGNVWLSVSVSMLCLASLFYLSGAQTQDVPSRLFYVYLYVIDFGLLSLAHIVAFRTLTALRVRGRHMRRILLVGAGMQGRHVAVRLRGRESAGVTLVGYLSDEPDSAVPLLQRLGTPQNVEQVVLTERIDEVVIALSAEEHLETLRMTGQLQEQGISVRVLPDVFEMVAMRAKVEDFFGLPLISITEPSITPVQARVKRAFDLLLASIILAISSPVLIALAIWVRLDSSGPIFIHQRRIGARGTPFHMHKLRTMRWNASDLDTVFDKRQRDPRVTRAGKALRRTSLDELPQLWNVVRGEMSLVGPRPELPAIVEQYEPWQRKRFVVPPGMTGWWQVNGRSDRSMHLNTEIDLYYVQNYSILLDLEILAKTVGAVIKGKGAF